MLYSISSIITKYFFKKNIITNSDQEVFTYGCQLIISSFCSISSILLLSFFINITYGILFLLFFFPIRLFCGGFHASSATMIVSSHLHRYWTVHYKKEDLRYGKRSKESKCSGRGSKRTYRGRSQFIWELWKG